MTHLLPELQHNGQLTCSISEQAELHVF